MAGEAKRPDVLIAGGGVAALEALMALRDLAGDRVRITLVTPAEDFAYRPMAVAEPFGLGEVRRFPLAPIAAEFGAELVRGALSGVEAPARRAFLRDGGSLPYDTLILALGARLSPAFEPAVTFAGPESTEQMRGLLGELDAGSVRRVAFVAPSTVGWKLPLYELGLLTARHARERGLDVELALVTTEERPLAQFGAQPTDAVARLLDAAGIEFIGSSYADLEGSTLRLHPGPRTRQVDRVVALPMVRGPRLDGVPGDPALGFIPVDEYGRVQGMDDVYAAGDATTFPIKHGGLAARQADAVASHVAARHGAAAEPAPFRPVLHGMLFTGGPSQFMHAPSAGEGRTSVQALWWPPTKIAGRHLAPYLYARERGAAPGPVPEGFADLEIDLRDAEVAAVTE